MNFHRGQRVIFGRDNGEKTLGEIVRVNSTTATVRQLEERGGPRERPATGMWRVPFRLLTPEGASVQAPAALARPEVEILRDIGMTYSGLSPENLFADGLRSRVAASRRRVSLERQLRALFVEIGRTVSEDEAYSALRASRAAAGF